MLKYKVFNHILYVRVFEHNSFLGGFFNNAAEAKACDKPGKYSILGSMDQYKFGSKYQFMLYYPEVELRNIWRQTYNPCNESIADTSNGSTNVNGYEPILIQAPTNRWGGLCLSTTNYTFLDGDTAYSDWWFAVGTYCQYAQGYNTFPGPCPTPVHIAELWLACGEIKPDVRLNSNIYKRIFPSQVINMDYVQFVKDDVKKVKQNNHGFSPGQFVFKDDNGIYKLSCANKPETAWVHGMVTEVIDANSFICQRSGKYPWRDLGWEETTVVYLSDKEPGGTIYYASIKSMIYTPVGFFAGDCLIICPQQPSLGNSIREYDRDDWIFDNYTGKELLEAIDTVYDHYRKES